MSKILVIEDDPTILRGLVQHLTAEGYEVLCAQDGTSGLEQAGRLQPELIILDLMLPGLSGYEVCRRLRSARVSTKILILSARTEEFDRVLGLDIGADDYVTKPFSLTELCARIRALMRRGEPRSGVREYVSMTFGDVAVEFAKREVRCKGLLVKLTRKEFEVLEYLLKHADEVVTREALLEEVWGMDLFPTMRTVDNHIAHFRSKLDDPLNPQYFATVHGVGYRFTGTVTVADAAGTTFRFRELG